MNSHLNSFNTLFKINTVLTITISILTLLPSCGKKNSITTTPETTTQKIQHIWNLVSIQDIQYEGASTSQIDTIIDYALSGDYIEFNLNNKAYLRIAGAYDTVVYNVLNDNKIILDSDTFTINTLSSNDLKMTYYGRETNPINNWDNVITLNR